MFNFAGRRCSTRALYSAHLLVLEVTLGIQRYLKGDNMQINREINGSEVIITFKPQSEDIKDKVLWLILECFKSRINDYLNSDSSNSLSDSK